MPMVNKIKGFRNMAGLTQEEMSKALEISSRAYQNKEKGNSNFTINEMIKIRDTLTNRGVPVTLDDLV